jgi:hypothetical protein
MIELVRDLPPGDFGVITDILHRRSHAEATLAAGDTEAALRQFRDLAAIDIPSEPREYLGRALLAAADLQPDAARSAALRREALQAYATVALHPGLIWRKPFAYPPGSLADESQTYLQLAQQLGGRGSDIDSTRARLTGLRGNHPSNPARAGNALHTKEN